MRPQRSGRNLCTHTNTYANPLVHADLYANTYTNGYAHVNPVVNSYAVIDAHLDADSYTRRYSGYAKLVQRNMRKQLQLPGRTILLPGFLQESRVSVGEFLRLRLKCHNSAATSQNRIG